jgi:hypothetical protein
MLLSSYSAGQSAMSKWSPREAPLLDPEHLPNRIIPTKVVIVTESLQDRMVARFSEVLDVYTHALPGSIPFVAPVRKLADAALEVLAMGRGVPLIPAYDAELAAQRTWTGVRSAAELAESLGFPQLEAVCDENMVVFTATNPDGQVCETRLPPNDAEEYALHILSAVTAARVADGITII